MKTVENVVRSDRKDDFLEGLGIVILVLAFFAIPIAGELFPKKLDPYQIKPAVRNIK